MNISLYDELTKLLVFVIDGIIICFTFDIFRSLRKVYKTKDLITYIEDIIFWCIVTIVISYSILKYNNGELRVYILIGIILGTCIYILLLSKICKRIIYNIFKFIKFIIEKIVRLITILFKPFRIAFKVIYKLCDKLFIKCIRSKIRCLFARIKGIYIKILNKFNKTKINS